MEINLIRMDSMRSAKSLQLDRLKSITKSASFSNTRLYKKYLRLHQPHVDQCELAKCVGIFDYAPQHLHTNWLTLASCNVNLCPPNSKRVIRLTMQIALIAHRALIGHRLQLQGVNKRTHSPIHMQPQMNNNTQHRFQHVRKFNVVLLL